MRELSSEIDAAESLMAELADEYLERLERGERPDIEEYVARWPGDPLVMRQALASLKLVRLSSVQEAGEFALEAADAAGRLGDFQLLREIGRGGMGVVYEAEQHSLGRRVALKLLPLAGMLDPRQLQRFKNEALAAAQLNHPNIVDVIAVGCERGVHYYAMRLIDGATLAEMIAALKRSGPSKSDDGSGRRHEHGPEDADGDAAKSADAAEGLRMAQPDVDPRAYRSPHAPREGDHHAERDAYGTHDVLEDLESTLPVAHLSTERPSEYYRSVARLLADAADALDYAHQSGVVHRDVKPSNLMLDSRGKVWVTDFGLARVESNTEMTMTGDLLGTLRYMSPEQASGNRRLLDHRTDVYSLGATLYELLTLRPAFASSDRGDLLRQIAETEPVAPRKIARSVPVDLETIALKALEKEPSQRYVTAAALAGDLRRFLEGKAIQARRAGPLELVARWSRRHRGLVVASTAVLAIAVIALAVSNYRIGAALDTANSATIAATNSAKAEKQMRIKATAAAEAEKAARLAEEAERRKAAAMADYFVKAFQASNPRIGRGDTKIIDFLDEAVEVLEAETGLSPEIRAAILSTFSNTYVGIDAFDKGVELGERSLRLMRAEFGPDHRKTLNIASVLIEAYGEAGRSGEAVQLAEQTLSSAKEILPSDDPDMLRVVNNLAEAYRAMERIDQAIPLLEDAFYRSEQKLGLAHASTLTYAYNLATAYAEAKQFEQSRLLIERVMDHAIETCGHDHSTTLNLKSTLAAIYGETGRLDEAVLLRDQALSGMRQLLGADHSRVVTAEFHLAGSLLKAGRVPDAISYFESAYKKAHKTLRPDHALLPKTMHELAIAYVQAGRRDEALPLLRQALAKRNTQLGSEHPETLTTMYNMARVLATANGDFNEAAQLYEKVLAGRRAKVGADDPLTVSTMQGLASVYREIGRLDESIKLFEEVLSRQEHKLGAGHPDTLLTLHHLAQEYMTVQRFDESLILRERHVAASKETLGLNDPGTLLSMNLLAAHYWKIGKLAKSIPIFEELLGTLNQAWGGEHPQTLGTMANLAVNYRDAGRLPEAIEMFEKALERARLHPEKAAHFLTWVPREMAMAYEIAGEFGKSEPLHRELLTQARKDHGNDDLATALIMSQLATNLLFQGKYADAEPIVRECLSVREAKLPDDWATFNARSLLGGSLLGQKKYAEAEPLLIAGYEGMGERADRIPPPAKIRVHEALERVVMLYDEWGKPEETANWAAKDPASLALCTAMRRRGRAAAELYQQAFESQPELIGDPTNLNRYHGACAAALAAAGEGTDAAELSDDERAKWRKQALAWLRAELDAWKQRILGNAKARTPMMQALSHWQQNPDLKSVRDDAALAALASDEQTAWREFWSEVAELTGSTSASVP